MLEVLVSDEYLTVINKPYGILVHKTSIADDDSPVVLQILKEQMGRIVYPVHRLDRPTTGVLVFAHSSDMVQKLQEEFKGPNCQKQYTALVRGWLNEPFVNSRQVKNDKGKLKDAETSFKPIQLIELPIPTDRYSTARYSIVRALPKTGRWHQIRQHLGQMRHYIVNDRVHGDGKQNRIFTEKLNIPQMFLHADSMVFQHPETKEILKLEADFPEHWSSLEEVINKL